MSDREQFLAGEALDEVAIYVARSAVDDVEPLREYAQSVEGGLLFVLPGEKGRSAFETAAGIDPMGLAQAANTAEPGRVDRDLTDGDCPADGDHDGDDVTHGVRFLFAFAEGQNEEVGGLYAEGAVVHAYAVCHCGERYGDRWLAGE